MHCLLLHWLLDLDPQSDGTESFHTATPTARSNKMHIYWRQIDPPVNWAQMPCILLHPLLDLVKCIYIEGRWTPSQLSTDALYAATPTTRSRLPSQLSTDALHTATPTARYSTMYIYRRQMKPPSQLSTDASLTATPTARYSTMHIYRRQMDPHSHSSIDALHTSTPTARSNAMHLYIEGSWTPSQSSIDALHTVTLTARSRPPQSIKHRCLAYYYTHC